ncbi:MAG: hypothetical protein AB1451_14700 [Nitrospirota bacterium]
MAGYPQDDRVPCAHPDWNDEQRLEIGKESVQQLATALGVQPAIIMFPEYEAAEITRVA